MDIILNVNGRRSCKVQQYLVHIQFLISEKLSELKVIKNIDFTNGLTTYNEYQSLTLYNVVG